MKDLNPQVLLAVFHEMLGPLLWVLLLGAIVVAAALVVLLARERRIESRRLVRAQAVGLLGGVAALALMVRVSSSGFMDAGGPIDWLLIAGVFVVGLLGVTLLSYTVAGWWTRARARAS